MRKLISRLIILIFAGYLFVNFINFKGSKNLPQAQMLNYLRSPSSSTSPSQTPTKEFVPKGTFIEKTITNIFLNILQTEEGKKIVQNINPSFKEDAFLSYQNRELTNFPIITKEGTGAPASCGDNLEFDYTKYDSNKNIIQDVTQFSLILNEKLEPIFKLILAKVKSQEEIENQIYQAANNEFEIHRINIKNIKFNSLKNPQYFLKQLQVINGTGKKALCGDSIKLQITLEKTPDDQEPSHYSLVTTLGSHDLPREITEVLLTQRYGTKFTFATNKKLLDSVTQQNMHIFHTKLLNKDSFAILTLELLSNS